MPDVTIPRSARPILPGFRSTGGPLSRTPASPSLRLDSSSAPANPASSLAAQGLSSRARDLALIFDSVSNAVRTLAAADRGIVATTNLVEAAQATAREALRSLAHGTNPRRAELVGIYNGLLARMDGVATDAGFDGVNLLTGDSLSVLFNGSGSSRLDIAGVDNTAAGLGLARLEPAGFETNSAINATLDALGGAIATLRDQSATFGASLGVVVSRQDFTRNMISVLQAGAATLSLADTTEEAANVLALHTRQQLSSTSLSLASRADQNVLRLF